ncbi:MAG: ClpX C4-type zinc finger protein [Tepidisphaeraceae bacterium]
MATPKSYPERQGDNPPNARCSFCGKLRSETGPMVEGPNGIYMCGKCVDLAAKIVGQMRQNGRLKDLPGDNPKTPDLSN